MLPRADLDLGDLNVSFQRNFHEDNAVSREDGRGVLALSAFMLSTLSTEHARKEVLKEMWESGAGTMVCVGVHSAGKFSHAACSPP